MKLFQVVFSLIRYLSEIWLQTLNDPLHCPPFLLFFWFLGGYTKVLGIIMLLKAALVVHRQVLDTWLQSSGFTVWSIIACCPVADADNSMSAHSLLLFGGSSVKKLSAVCIKYIYCHSFWLNNTLQQRHLKASPVNPLVEFWGSGGALGFGPPEETGA